MEKNLVLVYPLKKLKITIFWINLTEILKYGCKHNIICQIWFDLCDNEVKLILVYLNLNWGFQNRNICLILLKLFNNMFFVSPLINLMFIKMHYH